jgi:AcrR family transcriptional regulator
MEDTAHPSRDSLLEAATQVFMEQGFSGARVDEIARRAHANKAMIYYHFGSKHGLYKAVALQLFSGVLEEIGRLSELKQEPMQRLRGLYLCLSRLFAERPALPHIMLREILAGGEAMDAEVARVFGVMLRFVRSAIEQGRDQGAFRDVHPLLAHISMLAPLVVYTVSASFRERLLPAQAPDLVLPSPDAVVAQLLDFLERALTPQPETSSPTRPSEKERP